MVLEPEVRGVHDADRSLSLSPWRVIKTDDSDAVPSGSTVSTEQPFVLSFIPVPPHPRSNSALITASSIHQRIDRHDRQCGTH